MTQNELKQILDYNRTTGVFTWRVTRTKAKAGAVAGSRDKDGYIVIRTGGKTYKAHRLAWLYVYGEWPKGEIDHRKGIRDDNRISQLRDATDATNAQNRRNPHANNKSGYMGIFLRKRTQKWEAAITVNGVRMFLGAFDCPAEASKVYQSTKSQLHAV